MSRRSRERSNRLSRVVAATLHSELAVELEDLNALPARGRVVVLCIWIALVLVAAQASRDRTEVVAIRELRGVQNLGLGEDGIPGEERGGVSPGRVLDVADRVVSDVGAGKTEAQSCLLYTSPSPRD